MDFYRIVEKRIEKKNSQGIIELYPDFIVCPSKDLMIRGGSFYAIWDEHKQIWSTDEQDVQILIDAEMEAYKKSLLESINPDEYYIRIRRLSSFESKSWIRYKSYIGQMYDTYHQLNDRVIFSNMESKKTDYVSKRLPYPLEDGECPAYDEIMSTIYSPEERQKLEWAIGAVASGEAGSIQKFIVLYGEPGTGKSTFLNILQQLFEGYYTLFDAKSLTSSNSAFSMETFNSNPLVAIQHDGDLSKIEDNTRLNSIVSHEEMIINEKYKAKYTSRINAFLFLGTNEPVKIKNSRSGIIRRLIDVNPTGLKIPTKKYHVLTSQIGFELGAIMSKCLKVYREIGKNYYANYIPLTMMYETDMFFNFVEENYHKFKEQDGTTIGQAYQLYKEFCTSSTLNYILTRQSFRDELKSYFKVFHRVTRIDGKQVRSVYQGFLTDKFSIPDDEEEEKPYALVLDSDVSVIDTMLANCPAQYANEKETPIKSWSNCDTILSDIRTNEIHYVKPPLNHIVIDFDLKDDSGKKSVELNLEAASKWPATYAEFSKGGAGIHLHYIYDGDVERLSRVYSDGIEIKVFVGKSSLRRRLTKCNTTPVSTINSGLPLKGEKLVVNFDSVKSEKGLRDMIKRNLNKEIHPGTKPSVDFIYKILEDAYKAGLKFDVTDMRPSILSFASSSSNQAEYCVKLVSKMRFASEEISINTEDYKSDDLIFYDVEVFPNLFVVVWKKDNGQKVYMINPTALEIEPLLNFKLIGFNCRRYDNHIIYARYIGYDNPQLYELSQRIINGSRNAMFGEAYNISYTDIYDFASAGNKMSLKKWEIKLGIHHQELGLPWDQPVPEELWPKVAEYCGNDVDATEATFHALSGDWTARRILAKLSGLSVNDTTNQHTIKIVFGDNKHPQDEFVYTDLSEIFPGYKFENGKSYYRDVEVGEGGRVYAEPGIYTNVPVQDIISMHPNSIRALNLFGPRYTKRFTDIVDGRVAIKHKNLDDIKTLLDGQLVPFVEEALGDNPEFTLGDLAAGLKTAINSGYGLTCARFENPFKDPRNVDNIVAKRGALFMVDLQFAVQEQGFTVAHIKTDSIKIPNATPEIMKFVEEYGKKYGYEFEHEETYEKFCLLNDAVYIAKSDKQHKTPWGTKSYWSGTGAQFNPETNPYVFKTLFSHEKIEFPDMCETKSVTTALYLDMNESLGEDEHNYHFIGKVGAFCPIKPGCGGGLLCREKDGKYYAATGSKGYRWLESEIVKQLEREADIDRGYYNELVDAAVKDISKHGDFEWFVSDSSEPISIEDPIGFGETPMPQDYEIRDELF